MRSKLPRFGEALNAATATVLLLVLGGRQVFHQDRTWSRSFEKLSVLQAWAIVGAALGLAGFAVFWDGQARLVVEEGAIGAAMSLVLLVSAIEFPGAFG